MKMKDPDLWGVILTVGTMLAMGTIAFALLTAELTAP
jgi:hypothetical protein